MFSYGKSISITPKTVVAHRGNAGEQAGLRHSESNSPSSTAPHATALSTTVGILAFRTIWPPRAKIAQPCRLEEGCKHSNGKSNRLESQAQERESHKPGLLP